MIESRNDDFAIRIAIDPPELVCFLRYNIDQENDSGLPTTIRDFDLSVVEQPDPAEFLGYPL